MAISNFIPQVWSAEILLKLRADLKFAQPGVINRNYEGDVSAYGKTVNITDFDDVTVQAYSQNSTSLNYQTLTDHTRQLVISQQDYFAFQVDDVDRRQAMNGFISVATQGAAYKLAQATDTYVSGLMAGAGTANSRGEVATILGPTTAPLKIWAGTESYKTAGAAGDVSAYEVLLQIKIALDKALIPDDGQRFVIVGPDLYGYLLRDQRFVAEYAAGTTEGLRNGQVGRVLNMNVIVSNTAPADTTYNAGNLPLTIGGHPMATTFAEQIVETEAVRLQTSFSDAVRGLHVYGGLVVRPSGLVLAHTAVAAS